MSYYLLTDTARPCTEEELFAQTEIKYAAVLTTAEWARDRERFDMGIELDLDPKDIHNTKAEVNYDSLTGTFRIPDRENIGSKDYRFAFALDEKGVVFIDDSGKAEQMIDAIRRTKHWRKPSLERFLYDFLEQIVENDLSVMERYEAELNRIEDTILKNLESDDLGRVSEIHNDIRKLLAAFDALIARGHTIIIIEHNLEVIKCADHIIDLGPEGGDAGGNVLASGTPEEVAQCAESYTAHFLREKLGMK